MLRLSKRSGIKGRTAFAPAFVHVISLSSQGDRSGMAVT
ncbi:ArsC family reductase, partial [Mesorhizobium sp. M1A.T.Ca.IN.004.03.1.1]